MVWYGVKGRFYECGSHCHGEVVVSQPASLFLRLSRINWKSLFVGLDVKRENPKYLPKCMPSTILKELRIKNLSICEQFFEKKTFDFAKFIFWPDNLVK